MYRRELILNVIETVVMNFMYYDRKEDEDLQNGDIESAIEAGEISLEEIVQKFKECIEQSL